MARRIKRRYYEDFERHPGGPRWLPAVVFISITAIMAVPWLRNLHDWGIRDWDLFTTLQAAVVTSIRDYSQFPFWNPYIGGGNILFAHPEVALIHPFTILLLVFGTLVGLKLQVIAAYLIGFWGMHRLSRMLGISYWGALVPPAAYMLSSYMALHFAAGHISFHYFCAFPWLVYFYKLSLEKPVHILSAGLVLTFMILGSGAGIPLIFSLLFLFLFSLMDIGEDYGIMPPLKAIAAGICGLLFGAIKFAPMLDYFLRHPWQPPMEAESIPLWVLPHAFFNFNQDNFANHFASGTWGWHEYGAFIGPFTVILAGIGLVVRIRLAWKYIILIGISIMLMMGSFAPWSPWNLLTQAPFFDTMRVPSRFSLLAVFCIALLAGWGIDSLMVFLKHQRRILAAVLFAGVVITHCAVCWPILGSTFTNPPEPTVPPGAFKQIYGDPDRMYAAFLENTGTIQAAWISAYRPGRGILSPGGRVAQWYSQDEAVDVQSYDFSPNRLVLRTISETGGALVISMGYDAGWRQADGGRLYPTAELITVDVPRGASRVELFYLPDYFILGASISAVSLIAALVVYITAWRRSRRHPNLNPA